MITIDLDSTVPLTDQIVAAIRLAIAGRHVVTSDELPSVRQLASDLCVNFNTVARAYRALEASGLVRSARGRGTRVIADVELDAPAALGRSLDALTAALADARLAGIDRTQLEDHLTGKLDELWPGDAKED